MRCGGYHGERWQKAAFCGHRFPGDIIGRAVRWYLSFRLSYAEVAEWLAERR
jgi:transposase-like protein